MDRKRAAETSSGGEGGDGAPAHKRKLTRLADAKRSKRQLKMLILYKKYEKAMKKMNEREVPMGAEFNEAAEERAAEYAEKVTRNFFRIHNYLLKRGLLVSEDGETVKVEVDRELVVKPSSNEQLNALITALVNKKPPPEEAAFVGKYSHVTVEDVEGFIDELRKPGGDVSNIPSEPLELAQFIENVACEANKQVKLFIEDRHKESIELIVAGAMNGVNGSGADDASAGDNQKPANGDTDSSAHAGPVPSWETARMELADAAERGDLKVDEGLGLEQCDTSMPMTAEEREEEEGEEEEEDGEDLDSELGSGDLPSFADSAVSTPSNDNLNRSDSRNSNDSSNTIELSESEDEGSIVLDDDDENEDEDDDADASPEGSNQKSTSDAKSSESAQKCASDAQKVVELSGSEESQDVIQLDSSDDDDD